MILDVKSRRRNNIPAPPQTSDRRLEQSLRFVSRPRLNLFEDIQMVVSGVTK